MKNRAFIPTMLSILGMVMLPVSTAMAAPATASTNVQLAGNQALAATHGSLQGHKNPKDVVSVTLTLNLHNTGQLDSFLADLSNPASPNYKHYLTPAQFAAQYGPTAADVQKVTAFAADNGLTVSHVAANNQAVTVTGTVSQLEKAFGVTINNYTKSNGEHYFANANTPSVPSSIAGVVKAVVGLDNEAKHHTHYTTPSALNPNAGGGPSGGFTPTQLRSAYDITPLSSSYDGSGQNVAVVEFDGYVMSNVTTYDNYYGLGSPTPNTVYIDGYNGAAGSGEGEVELDVEVVNAIAPKAQVTVYEAPNSDQGELDMYQRIANDNISKTVSISWGECEAQANSATMSSLHNILAQMAAQGQSVYAAAGDSGAYDCGDGTTLSVDNPANDPYVTGVGGTHLTLTSSNAYSSEKVWSSLLFGEGGGGGISKVYSMPSWQSGTGVQNSYSTGYREVPDVSADADPNTGYSIYSGGSWTVYGGTSCAAPLWAGITALNNQYAATRGEAGLGQANPTLYRMFNTTQAYNAYHDITSGKNLYYPATSGYDQASGIGTPDAYNLIRDINGN